MVSSAAPPIRSLWECGFFLLSLVQAKPGLRLMQYKSLIFEKWSKSPLNPRNQKPVEK